PAPPACWETTSLRSPLWSGPRTGLPARRPAPCSDACCPNSRRAWPRGSGAGTRRASPTCAGRTGCCAVRARPRPRASTSWACGAPTTRGRSCTRRRPRPARPARLRAGACRLRILSPSVGYMIGMRTTLRRPVRRIVAACLLAASAALAACGSSSGPEAAARRDVVYRIPVHGTIELGLAPFVERSLREAAAAGAAAAVLEIETPGGRVDAAQRIVNAVSDSEVPVYAFINRRAYSAGAMVALATRGIYMRPG